MKHADDKELIKSVEKWVTKIGRNEAMAMLVRKGVGTTTAERLVNGRYDSRPSSLLRTTLSGLVNTASEAS